MDMMRPESLALPPSKASGLSSAVVGTGKNARIRLTWQDNSINETSFVVQRTSDGTTWVDVGTVVSPLDQPNIHQARAFVDPTASVTTPYLYRVVALNTVGYGSEFPSMTVKSVSDPVGVNVPLSPTGLTAALQTGPKVSLTWQDNATNESGFVVERSSDSGVTFSQVGTAPARNKTGTVTFVDGTVALGSTYQYRVSAVNAAGRSTTPPITVQVSAPSVPAGMGTAVRAGSNERMTMTWSDVSNASSYAVRWSSTGAFTTVAGTSPTITAGTLTYTTGNVARQVWYVEVRATNVLGSSAWSSPVQVAAAP
jgi:hypothetical protein